MVTEWCDVVDLRLEAAVSPGRPLRWGPLPPDEVNDSRLNYGRVWGPWDVPPGLPDGDSLFIDISEALVELQWTGGTSSSDTVFPRWEAAQCRAVFKDPRLLLDPTNPGSPFRARLAPNTPVRIRAGIRPAPDEPATELVTVFAGYVDSWSPQWAAQPRERYTEMTATDGTRILANFNTDALAAPVGAGETAAQRINRILNHALWPDEDRDITPGGIALQSTDHAQPAWTELLLTADSDMGFVWIEPGGNVKYLPGEVVRARLEDPTPDFVFGCGGFDVLLSATPAFNTDGLRNVVAASNGTSSVVVADEPSVFRYRASTYQRFDLKIQSGTELNLWAQRVVWLGSNPRRTISQILIDPMRDPDCLAALLLPDQLDIWRIVWDPPGDETAHVVTVDVTPGGWVHTVTPDAWSTVVTTGLVPRLES